MDILTGERPVKLEYRYLKAADQEKERSSDEDLFPFQVSRVDLLIKLFLILSTIHLAIEGAMP